MTDRRVVRIGTRGSELALVQAHLVGDAIRHTDSSVTTEYAKIKTEADHHAHTPLHKMGGKGAFVKEIELALMHEEIDLAVHSMKDLPPPGEQPSDHAIALLAVPVLDRASPWDVLIAAEEVDLDCVPEGFRVGTSSPRRRAQLLRRWPHVKTLDIRGNVPTRIGKMMRGEFDAIVLAEAGIERLGLKVPWMRRFPPEEILPAAHQGTLAVQINGRNHPPWLYEIIHSLIPDETSIPEWAEKSFVRAMNGDCHSAIAAHARRDEEDRLHLRTRILSSNGNVCLEEEGRCHFSRDSAGDLGRHLADRMKKRGAEDILHQSEQNNDD